jgi:hypothetical protein
MACFRPLRAWQRPQANANGKRPLVFQEPPGGGEPLQVPCGQCIGCREDRSRDWALRCVHEASMYQDNCFITLTYDPVNQPKYGNLDYTEFQRFMKRLRKLKKNIRFYMCGEYGENLEYSKNGKFGHPHYHACIFNYDFKDKYLYSRRNGIDYYRSDTLERLWPLGFSTIGDVTLESAAYCARYIMKKRTGKGAKELPPGRYEKHYELLDLDTGELIELVPEFTKMSLKPGIGATWREKYKGDLEKDFITIGGMKRKPPKFYDRKLELEEPEKYKERKEKRVKRFLENQKTDYYDRLDDGEKIKIKQMKRLVRNL